MIIEISEKPRKSNIEITGKLIEECFNAAGKEVEASTNLLCRVIRPHITAHMQYLYLQSKKVSVPVRKKRRSVSYNKQNKELMTKAK